MSILMRKANCVAPARVHAPEHTGPISLTVLDLSRHCACSVAHTRVESAGVERERLPPVRSSRITHHAGLGYCRSPSRRKLNLGRADVVEAYGRARRVREVARAIICGS